MTLCSTWVGICVCADLNKGFSTVKSHLSSENRADCNWKRLKEADLEECLWGWKPTCNWGGGDTALSSSWHVPGGALSNNAVACYYVPVILSTEASRSVASHRGEHHWTPSFSLTAFLCYWTLLAVSPTPHQLATMIPSLSSCFPFFSSSPPGTGSVLPLGTLPELQAEAMCTSCKVGKATVGELSDRASTDQWLWVLHAQWAHSASCLQSSLSR